MLTSDRVSIQTKTYAISYQRNVCNFVTSYVKKFIIQWKKRYKNYSATSRQTVHYCNHLRFPFPIPAWYRFNVPSVCDGNRWFSDSRFKQNSTQIRNVSRYTTENIGLQSKNKAIADFILRKVLRVRQTVHPQTRSSKAQDCIHRPFPVPNSRLIQIQMFLWEKAILRR